MAKITEALLKDLLRQMSAGVIPFSKVVDKLNEVVSTDKNKTICVCPMKLVEVELDENGYRYCSHCGGYLIQMA